MSTIRDYCLLCDSEISPFSVTGIYVHTLRPRHLIGARKLAQVKDNLACVDVRLESALVQRLDAVSRVEMGFPHDLFAKEMVRSLSSGGMRDQIDAR
jgi:hypothetical protein